MRPGPNAELSGEIIMDWLHKEGWTVAHSKRNGGWVTQATKGSKRISTSGITLEEARSRATEEAKNLDLEVIK